MTVGERIKELRIKLNMSQVLNKLFTNMKTILSQTFLLTRSKPPHRWGMFLPHI